MTNLARQSWPSVWQRCSSEAAYRPEPGASELYNHHRKEQLRMSLGNHSTNSMCVCTWQLAVLILRRDDESQLTGRIWWHRGIGVLYLREYLSGSFHYFFYKVNVQPLALTLMLKRIMVNKYSCLKQPRSSNLRADNSVWGQGIAHGLIELRGIQRRSGAHGIGRVCQESHNKTQYIHLFYFLWTSACTR